LRHEGDVAAGSRALMPSRRLWTPPCPLPIALQKIAVNTWDAQVYQVVFWSGGGRHDRRRADRRRCL